MTTGTEAPQLQAVSRETVALIPLSPEGEGSTPVDDSARAEALSWAPNTRKAYLAGSNDFTNWCIAHRCLGLPATPAVVGRCLKDLVETRGKTLATAWANTRSGEGDVADPAGPPGQAPAQGDRGPSG